MSGTSPIFPNQLQHQILVNARSEEQKSTNVINSKPQHSYIGLIAKAILSTKEKRMLLNEIYDWISDNYPYFRCRGSGWRNSVRHNLSLNDCFVKEARSPNGKGHYWTIHPANLLDFSHGDFRRKHAAWKIKTHEIQALQAEINREIEPKRAKAFDIKSLLSKSEQ